MVQSIVSPRQFWFLSLERRMSKNLNLYKMYMDFMTNYLEWGHMSRINVLYSDPRTYYMPYHGVLRPSNGSQTLRVVFDAPAKYSDGISLNDTLFSGPKLQNDFSAILLRFPLDPVVFTCDIRQMYRQILISEEQRRYQFTRWRYFGWWPSRHFSFEQSALQHLQHLRIPRLILDTNSS